MPLSRIQTSRSGTAAQLPAAPRGGLYVNTADRQFGVRDFDGAALNLLAVTRHSEHPSYVAGALVTFGANLYKCRTPTTGVFDPTKWWNLSAGPAFTTMTEPTAPHRDGELWFDRNPSAGAQLKVWVAETGTWGLVGTDRMPFIGGTFTGIVSHPFTPTAQDHLVRKKYVDDTLLNYVPKTSPYNLDKIRLATSGPGAAPSLQFGTTGTGFHMYSTSPEPYFIVDGANRAKIPPRFAEDIEGLSLLTMDLAEQLYLPLGANVYSIPRLVLTTPGSAVAPVVTIGSGTGFYRTDGGRLAVVRDGVLSGVFMHGATAEVDELIRRDYADGRYIRSGLASYSLSALILPRTNSTLTVRFDGDEDTGMRLDPDSNTPFLYVDGDLVARWPERNPANDGTNCLVTRERGDDRYQRKNVGAYVAAGRVTSAGDLAGPAGTATSASRVTTGTYRVFGDFTGWHSVQVTLWGGGQEGKSHSVTAVGDTSFEVNIYSETGIEMNHAFQFVVF